MKISEITRVEVKDYLHVYHDDDNTMLDAILVAAKAFVGGYTGLTAEQLDTHEDLSMAVFIISAELYDNRVYTVDKNNVNPAIQAILQMYSINLL